MTIATGARHDLSFIVESTYGTTPSTPAFTKIRHTGTTLGLSKEALESEELREDRQVQFFRHGTKSVGGDINFELSYGGLDSLIEAVFCGTWNSNVLVPANTRRSFTIERHFEDIDKYIRLTGCHFNTMSLSLAPNSLVTGAFGVIGKDGDTASSGITGATYGAESNTKPFDSFTGSINEGGSSIGTITALELSIENGMEATYAVGDATTKEPPLGQFRVTGSITAYLDSMSLVDKFQDETASTISFTLTDAAGNDYTFEMDEVQYNSGNPEVGGPGSVTVSLDFIALYDTSATTNLKITRAPA